MLADGSPNLNQVSRGPHTRLHTRALARTLTPALAKPAAERQGRPNGHPPRRAGGLGYREIRIRAATPLCDAPTDARYTTRRRSLPRSASASRTRSASLAADDPSRLARAPGARSAVTSAVVMGGGEREGRRRRPVRGGGPGCRCRGAGAAPAPRSGNKRKTCGERKNTRAPAARRLFECDRGRLRYIYM